MFLSYDRQDIEILVLPNKVGDGLPANPRIREIATGAVSPAKKRDIGALQARGTFLVFLDDDSYVFENYFHELDKFYAKHNQCAVGGPGITPLESSSFQLASGSVYESQFLSSNPERYIPKGNQRSVKDWPSVNFSLPKATFLKIGGFGNEFWPGEDTYFCLKLIESGVPIFYLPTLIAFHHRRTNLSGHLKQVINYGLHRGNFARHYPKNSRILRYFLPSIFTVYLGLIPIWMFFGSTQILHALLSTEQLFMANILWGLPLSMYALLLSLSLIDIAKRQGIFISLHTIYLFPLTHVCYGIFFLKGFLKNQPIESILR
jgi:GT2 family glycosyltransferase